MATSPVLAEMNPVLRVAKGIYCFAQLARDNNRTALAIQGSALLNAPHFARFVSQMSKEEEGRALLQERPSIDSAHVDLDQLLALPAGSLGHAYAAMLRGGNLDPDIFQAPDGVPSPEERYTIQRIRQTHDLWHVLTGYGTDVLGELELQSFTYGQLRAPNSLLIVLFGSLRQLRRLPGLLGRLRAAYQRGKAARFLLPVRWESLWGAPVTAVRAWIFEGAPRPLAS